MMDNRDMPEIPIQKWRPISHKQETVGLTARAHFAGLAMQGILANKRLQLGKPAKGVALCAVRHADALISALETDLKEAVSSEIESIRGES
jgi:hypothetical protein